MSGSTFLAYQPLKPRIPFWRTRKGAGTIAIIFAIIVVAAVVGGVVPTKGTKPNNFQVVNDSNSTSGPQGIANNTQLPLPPIATNNTGAGANSTSASNPDPGVPVATNLVDPGVAAVTWQNDGLHIRVYFQKDDGGVYEGAWDQGNGWSSSNTKLVQAKSGTPLAAITFDPTQIRVYYIDESNVLQEYVYNNGWSKGSTLPSPNISPTTSLSAVTWGPSSSEQVRVYYQKQDNTVQEVVYSSGWSLGNSFGDQANPGTGLGAILATDINNTPSLRVYWQAKDLTLNEYNWSGSWSNRNLNWSPAPSSGIAAASWTDSSGNPFVRVYYENSAGTIEEVGYNSPSGWVVGPGAPTSTVVGSQTPISAIVWVNGGDIEIRVYVQNNSSDTHTEFAYSGSWTSSNLGF
ncbi:fucose-specific lectin [Pluteus cervinus]|uniref:Fucose-specific lectin n=1 Tax=Pluteus cervinus TaxID=181527 RepID=A0ACD3A4Z7_9AGAR|nr:fucose-specific lectin [Pluteus cervinus]